MAIEKGVEQGSQEQPATNPTASQEGAGGGEGFNPALFRPVDAMSITQHEEGEGGDPNADPTLENPEGLSPEEQEEQAKLDADIAALSGEESGEGEGDANSDAPAGEETKIEWLGGELTLVSKPEVVKAFADKGFDINELNKEFYSDGLTDETRTKLNEAYGEHVVDLYISGIEAKLEAQQMTAASQYTKQVDTLSKLSGGKHPELFKWANDNLSADEYKEIQTAINTGNPKMMKYAIAELKELSGIGGKPQAQEPPAKTSMIKGGRNTMVDSTANGISQQEYTDAMVSGEYYKDTAKFDRLRTLGMKNGL